ncbi:PglZ domain-containing protein [bacterium]|nr:PglZ domain-containing protein [bacterium]
MRLREILKRKIEERLYVREKFLWIVDPLALSPEVVKGYFPDFSLHIYDNPVDFRLFYEPLREKMEENEPAEAIIISSREDIPPDVRRYCPQPLIIKPSTLFTSLHPIVDDILVRRELLEKVAPNVDEHKRSYEETVEFLLRNLLDVPISPAIGDAFNILIAYHSKDEGIPVRFIEPYLNELTSIGYSLEELLEEERFIAILRELIIAFLERESKTDLGADKRARRLLTHISLKPGEMLRKASEKINWEEIVDKIPLKPFFSPILPGQFYERLSEKLFNRLCKNRRDKEALDFALHLKENGRASKSLEAVLDCSTFLSKVPLPDERKNEKEQAEEWLSLAREFALQWKNFMEIPLDSELSKEWRRKREYFNSHFINFILKSYPKWMKKPRPRLSCDVLAEAVRPYLKNGFSVYLLVIDGMTYAQWAIMEEKIKREMEGYDFVDKGCFAILPTATPFSRNSIFAGEFPFQIVSRYGSNALLNNEKEEQFLRNWVKEKIDKNKGVIYCRKRDDWEIALRERADLKAFILNFTDELTHLAGRVAESEVELLKFVATKYEFLPLKELYSAVKRDSAVLVITSDHGSTWVGRTTFVPWEMHEEAVGRSARYYRNPKRYELREKEVLLISREEARNWGLPDTDNYYLSYGNFMFKRGQLEGEMAVHGGISLWEMCVPLAIFTPRR